MLWSGRPDEAKQSLDKQRLEAIERGAEPDGALLVLYVVWAQVWKGDIAGAVSTGAEALRAAIAAEDKIALAMAYSADALASAYCGDEVRARADAEQAAGLFSAMGWRSGAIWSSWALGLLELSLGDNQAVDAVLGPMASVVGNMTGADPVLAVFVPDHAEALIRLGEHARAEALVDAFERKAHELERTWALAAAARCRGLLAGARGDLDSGAECLAQALVLHEAAGLPFETARSLLELGCLRRRQKQRRLARLKLEQAHDAFTEMGARLWAGRCEVELARVARPSHPSGLSATEETIAKLAADGLTNRAIAARSFVTVKTVEANLAARLPQAWDLFEGPARPRPRRRPLGPIVGFSPLPTSRSRSYRYPVGRERHGTGAPAGHRASGGAPWAKVATSTTQQPRLLLSGELTRHDGAPCGPRHFPGASWSQ